MGLLTEVETRQLEQLIADIDDLRRRVTALEEKQPVRGPSLLEPAAPIHESTGVPGLSSGLLPAVGRLLLGIAGAYFLRAITESHVLPQFVGTIIGLLYAAAWLIWLLRPTHSDRLIIGLQALTASLIAGPLVWEATVRFHSISTTASACALGIFIVLGQVIGGRPNLAMVTGVTALAGSVTTIALIIATLDPIPYAIALTLAAAVGEWGACRDRTLSTRWIVAIAADFCAFILIYVRTRPQGLPEGYAPVPAMLVIAVLIACAASYLASTLVRTLVRRLPIEWFEIAQVAAAVILAIAGVLQIAQALAASRAVGACCLIGGVFCYREVFTKLRGRNFHAYMTFAILLTVAGSTFLFPTAVATALWIVLAVFSTWLGERRNGNTLRMHGALYLLAAAFASGLIKFLAQSTTGAVDSKLSVIGGMCAVAAVTAYAFTLRARSVVWKERIVPAIFAGFLCWLLVGLIAGEFLNGPLDRALASTLRTVLICAIAVVLVWFGRQRHLSELIWILYPWMTLGGFKLFAEDFRQGSAATLFVSLLVYGGTLIALSRLWRRTEPVETYAGLGDFPIYLFFA